jgi:hypothetical protein
MLFESAAEVKTYALIAFAVLNNVIALYYYIQLIKGAWVDPPDENLPRLEANKRQKIRGRGPHHQSLFHRRNSLPERKYPQYFGNVRACLNS